MPLLVPLSALSLLPWPSSLPLLPSSAPTSLLLLLLPSLPLLSSLPLLPSSVSLSSSSSVAESHSGRGTGSGHVER